MTATIRIQNTWSRIEAELPDEAVKKLDDALSYQVAGSKYAIDGWESKHREKMADNTINKRAEKYGRRLTEDEKDEIREYWATCELQYKWDGRMHFWNKGTGKIPTGLVKRSRKILEQYGPVVLMDQRQMPSKMYGHWRTHDFTPFADQSEIIKKAIDRQRGIIQAPTGFGKTELIAMLTAELGRKTLILIHRETIFKQLVQRIHARLKVPVGTIGGGVFEPDVVTVAMLQTVTQPRYEEFLKQFPVIIADECHHISADTFYKVMMTCSNAFFRYGFSATPWRDSGDDLYIEAALGGYLCKISPSQLIEKNRLTKPYIYFIHNPAIPAFNKLSWQKQYVKCIVQNDFRNGMILAAAYEMWKRKKTVLIAVTQINHGKRLEKIFEVMYPTMRIRFIQGENESREKQKALKDINDHKLDIIIATSVFGEGIDIPNLDCIINGKGQESRVDVFQLIGRMLRKTKTKDRAYFVDFYDQEKYTRRHSEKRFDVLDIEPEFEVKHMRSIKHFLHEFDNDVALENVL